MAPWFLRSHDGDASAGEARALAVDWDRVADGRLWGLRRGREFVGDPREFARSIPLVAVERGKIVRAAIDKVNPDCVWVQFADAEAKLGGPCPCGSYDLVRIHASFSRCTSCHSQLMHSGIGLPTAPLDDDEEDEDDDSRSTPDNAQPRSAPRQGLALFKDVHLSKLDSRPDRERYFGYGRDGQARVALLMVTVPLVGGERIPDPESPFGCSCQVASVPAEPFGELLDTKCLEQGAWEIVLT